MRVEIDVQKPRWGCSPDTGDFQRLSWIWSGEVLNVRLAECPACTLEYSDKQLGQGLERRLLEGSAQLRGPQRATFELSGLEPGTDVVGFFAQRCPGEHCGEYASTFREVDVRP